MGIKTCRPSCKQRKFRLAFHIVTNGHTSETIKEIRDHGKKHLQKSVAPIQG